MSTPDVRPLRTNTLSLEETKSAASGWRAVARENRRAIELGIALCPDVYEHNAMLADRVASEFEAKAKAIAGEG